MEHNENFLLFLFVALLFKSHSVQSTVLVELISFYVVPAKNLRKRQWYTIYIMTPVNSRLVTIQR